VRRIEALAGEAAVRFARGLYNRVLDLAARLGAPAEALEERVEKLEAESKAKGREIARLKRELARAQLGGGSGGPEVRTAGDWRYVAVELSGLDMPGLRQAADELLEKTGADLVAVGSEGLLVIKVKKEAEQKGLSAGALMRRIAEKSGGRGGGKAALAQGGGFDLEKAFRALAEELAG